MRAKTRWALAAAVAGLVLSGPGARAAIYTGGPGASYAMSAMTNRVPLGAAVTISSAANQSFLMGYAPVAIATITIADDPATPGIKSGTPISVWIPAGLVMTWDETNQTPAFGGTAAGKVGAIGYTNANQRLTIAVTADFSAGDTLTIGALSFKNFLAPGSGRLLLDYDNDGIADAQDDKTLTIQSIYSGGPGDCYAMNRMSQKKPVYLPAGTIFSIY